MSKNDRYRRRLFGHKFFNFLETASREELETKRIGLKHGLKSTTFPKNSKPYWILNYKYLCVVWALDLRWCDWPVGNRYHAVREDGHIIQDRTEQYSDEDVIFNLNCQSFLDGEPAGWRMLTETEVVEWRRAHNVFSLEDFREFTP